MKGHCPVCDGFFDITQTTNSGDAGHREDNEAANYRLAEHNRDDVGGECGGSNLPPDSLE